MAIDPQVMDQSPAASPLEPKKLFRKEGLGYVWELPGHQLVFRADYIHRSRDAVTASIAIESTAPGVKPHVYRGRLGLESPTSQAQLAKHLTRLTGFVDGKDQGGKPWTEMIQSWCSALLNQEEQTLSIRKVGRLPAREKPIDRVERIIQDGKPTILYGDSSAGKGWLATAMCVCVATGHPMGRLAVRQGRALYLDWEDDQWTFNDRIQAIARGFSIEPPEIDYDTMRGPLKRHFRALAQRVSQEQYDLLVIDSVGLAAGTVGERGSYEDVAIDLFDQLRMLPCAALLIDHVNSDGRNQTGIPDKSLGSIYKRALARSQWFVKKDQDTESNILHVGLFQTKTNHSATSKPLGFRITFESDGNAGCLMGARLESEDIRDVESLERSRASWERIRDYLGRVGTASTKEIADELELSTDVVRVECGRRKTVFVRTGEKRWGVLAQDDRNNTETTNVTVFRSYRDNDFASDADDLPFS